MTWDWSKICGHGNNFTVLEDHDFGYCFEQLVFVCTTHVLLACVSLHHLCKHHRQRVLGVIPRSPTLHLRLGVCILLLLAPLALLVLTYLYLQHTMSLISILSVCIKAATWFLHSSYVLQLNRYYHLHIRGTTLAVVSFLLTTASSAIQLYSTIRQAVHDREHRSMVEEYSVYVTVALHLLYLLTLIPSKRPSLQQSSLHLPVNGDSTEQDSLLNSVHSIGSYGSIEEHVGAQVDSAGCLSRFTFWWVQPVMKKGAHGEICSPADLCQLPKELNTKDISLKFQSILVTRAVPACEIESRECEGHGMPEPHSYQTPVHQHHPEDPSQVQQVRVCPASSQQQQSVTLLQALNKAFGLEYYSLGLLKLVSDSAGFAGPILLNLLVKYMENPGELVWHGYLYALGLFLSTLVGGLCTIHFNYHIQVVGLKIRAAIITTVYHKTMATGSVALSQFTTGQIVNFMSTDTDRIVNFCPSFHSFWSLPFQIGVSLYLLHQQVGLAFLSGLGFALLLIPINRWLAVKIQSLSTAMMDQKDKRVKMMNEVLYGIRVIKFYAWECHFWDRVERLRSAELSSLKGRKYLDALCVYFWATTPIIISILTFTTYVLLGHQLTAAKVFTSLALFNILIMPLNAFPWVINGLMEAWVSLTRVHNYLKLEELNWSKYYCRHSGGDPEVVLCVTDGQFSWDSGALGEDAPAGDEELVTCDPDVVPHRSLRLSGINLSVKKGQLVGVLGKVGSGKSSLLGVFLGEMCRVTGTMFLADLRDGAGLAAQESWIQNASLRDNILFGRAFNQQHYEATLQACCLTEDLQALPAGDETEIGENGVTLSGGQKARVSLARAVYQEKAVYLLDDPLAAVDAHVAEHLFKQCIVGLLVKKTRILCTHHTRFLQHADVVVVMEDGCMTKVGPPEEVLTQVDLDSLTPSTRPEQAVERNEQGATDVAEPDKCKEKTNQGLELVQEEERDTGIVKFHIYKSYWRAVGPCLAPLVLLSLFLMQASRNMTDWWLSYWVTHSNDHITNSTADYQDLRKTSSPWYNLTEADDNVVFYLAVYGGLAGANSLFTLVRAFLFAYGGLCAAKSVHHQLLDSILKAPVGFFDVTPIGRLLNRFSSDLYAIDDSLPFILNILLAQFYSLLGTLAITCYGLPWFVVLLVPLGVVYYFIQRYYRHSSREIKRISSITLSPIYAHFSESISGIMTIRALRHVNRFEQENASRLEENQRAQFAGQAVSQWLGMRLMMLGVSMVTGVALIAVLEHHFHSVNPGLVGLAISYALSITNLLSGVVTSFTETEKQMVSIERASQYIHDIPQESQRATLNVPPFWPIQGAVTFQGVYLQYRPGLPNALAGITFESSPMEKIGIVGRTGSGKSSLFLVLFRMVDIQDGAVLIDGINLRHLELQELRSRLAIIPQDPFLFSGTVRENLDPTGIHSDSELWTVVRRCHLKDVLTRHGGLGSEVTERGRPFSVGQRQLLCLARALLTRAKVLCVDEATASVDQETDSLIQQTIRQEFRSNTILMIAHRIRTVLDSDRVLVMQKGRVVEFEPPSMLLRNPESVFYKLVHGHQ